MISKALFFLGGVLLVQCDFQFQEQQQNQGSFNQGDFPSQHGHHHQFSGSSPGLGALPPQTFPIGAPAAFVPPPDFGSTDSLMSNSQLLKQAQSTGSAAAAGNAGTAGQGSATSINQANQVGTKDMTQASGLSANTATGFGSSASGAAQANGQLTSAEQLQHQFASTNNAFVMPGRKRRHVYYGMDNIANANAVGGGNAQYGQIQTSNNAMTFTNPFDATGFAAGNAFGQGVGVSIFDAANSQAQSGYRSRRQINPIMFPDFEGNSQAGSNAVGGGSAVDGNLITENHAFTFTNPFYGIGSASGKAAGSGHGISIFDAANANSNSHGLFHFFKTK